MNKKVLKIFTSMALLTLVMSGCNQDKPSDSNSASNSVVDNSNSSSSTSFSDSSSSSTSTSSTSVSSDSSSSSSAVEVETYSIRINTAPNATVTLSKDRAAAGEIITISVTPDAGYMVSSVSMNGTELSLSSLSFKMPATSVRIDVVTTLIDKDGITIGGDLSVKLVDEDKDGIFIAKNVKVEKDANIYYTIDGGITTLGVVQINNYKTFANITSSSGKNGGFKLAGNAIYDFYYDSNDLSAPCYIQRVGVINLPTNEDMVADLFEGTSRSESSLYPMGVNKVEYTSSSKNEKYEWNLYSDNSSYAAVTTLTGRDKAIVYKAQEGNIYKVVDNYLEGAVNPTYVTRNDKTAYSGQYDIVDYVSQRKYQYLQSEVNYDSQLYSHTMESLDAEFYQAYRNGYVNNIYNDVTVSHDATVTSSRIDNGDFTVSLNSWIRWAESANYSESIGLRSAYIVYELDITFTPCGAIRSGTYKCTIYDETAYDFTSNQFKTGYESVEPKTEVSFAYSYGDALSGKPNVDVSKYFTNEISSVVVKGKQSEEGYISVSEDLKAGLLSDADKSYTMTYVCLPATALDGWQYGTVASSDLSVIAPRMSSTPYELRAVKAGSATVTIGNHTASCGVKKDVIVNVVNAPFIKGIYMHTVYPYDDYDETFFADKGIVVSGRKYELQLAGKTTSGNTVMNNLDISFNYSSDLFTLSYDNESGKMTIDATNANVSENTTVRVEVMSAYSVDVETWPHSYFTFTVTPRVDYENSLVGIWRAEEMSTYIDITSETTGTIYYINGSSNKQFDFTYTYDSTSGKVNDLTLTSGKESDMYYTLKMYVDSADGALCVYFVGESMDWYDSTIEEYIGMDNSDDDWSDYIYVPFFKN